ncbi:hypothetical protein [Streptomyces sp. V3I7]|uniref:hypothetical protein n=1 Tax=Streptomyces sp. V3I7 TaxID=3042278 RepID=UPI0027842C11|nr:hypothetical protein [Streptomyces sp. V3I7]MDQ0990734.1 hypothetical protein [Streptomyces sp. V3I7]
MTSPNQYPAACRSGTAVGAIAAPTQAAFAPFPLRVEEQPAWEWSTKLLTNEEAGANARLRARPRLKKRYWPGNADAAIRVADKLVDNAVRHGLPFADGCVPLRMIVCADVRELLIEVDDAYPEFPGFDEAVNMSGEPVASPTGLWWVAHYRGRLSWSPKRDEGGVIVGKTVQVVLPITWAHARTAACPLSELTREDPHA